MFHWESRSLNLLFVDQREKLSIFTLNDLGHSLIEEVLSSQSLTILVFVRCRSLSGAAKRTRLVSTVPFDVLYRTIGAVSSVWVRSLIMNHWAFLINNIVAHIIWYWLLILLLETIIIEILIHEIVTWILTVLTRNILLLHVDVLLGISMRSIIKIDVEILGDVLNIIVMDVVVLRVVVVVIRNVVGNMWEIQWMAMKVELLLVMTEPVIHLAGHV